MCSHGRDSHNEISNKTPTETQELTMAANAAIALSPAKDTEFWKLFHRLTEQRVVEGNVLAGERLWEIGSIPCVPLSFTIRSTIDPYDFLECSWDAKAGVVTCRPGPAIKAGLIVFRLTRAVVPSLQHDTEECTVEQAIGLMLDRLVWIGD
jgi:hypothetical protein